MRIVELDAEVSEDIQGDPTPDVGTMRLVGRTIDGRYETHRLVARGGTALVVEATDHRTHRQVALKVFLHGSREVDAQRRFLREVEALHAVEHPALVRVIGWGMLATGEHYLAMDLVDGEPLRALIRRRTLTPGEAARLLRPVAEALDQLHAAGLVHRDVKPDNIIVRGDDDAVLIDLGIAFAFGEASGRLTARGYVVGSPRYVAPEAPKETVPAPAWDVYSLGVVFYEALCGAVPFAGTNVDVLVDKVAAPAPRMGDVAGGPFSADLEAALGDALDRDPVRRPSSCVALVDRIERCTLEG